MPTQVTPERPFFSILIPSYNRPEFVGTAVASVLASDFDDYEIIVSDDCSPRQAEIVSVLDQYLSDPRLRVHAQSKNLGEPANREFLSRAARGDWQVILSDDDLIYPRALGVLADAIRLNPGVDLFTFGYTVIDERSRPKFSRYAPKALRIQCHDRELLREFLFCDAFPFWLYQPATFCSHSRVRDKIKPNAGVGIGDDVQFLFDYVNDGGTILVIPEVLMCYRKMGAMALHLQGNQSGVPLANSESRYRIMVEMGTRRDICPEVRAIVSEPSFRQRFVYDTIVVAAAEPATIAAQIGMQETHREELSDYCKGRNRTWAKAKGYLARCRFFVRIFGLAGAAEILHVGTQRSMWWFAEFPGHRASRLSRDQSNI